MKNPIIVKSLRPSAKWPIFEFEGLRYYRRPPGYYRSDELTADGEYLHRKVWIANRGPIPPGHDVHHKDHNRSNNKFGNLKMLSEAEHHRQHMLMPERIKASRKNMREVVGPAAAAWRRRNPRAASRIGKLAAAGAIKWLKEQPLKKLICSQCGAKYKALALARQPLYFCSHRCTSAHRRASGIDDERRACRRCGDQFIRNRHSKIQFCTRVCAGKFRFGT